MSHHEANQIISVCNIRGERKVPVCGCLCLTTYMLVVLRAADFLIQNS